MVATATTWIEKTPGLMGGEACLRHTRFAVWLLEAYRRLGSTDEELVDDYEGLTPEDLSAAWEYVAANPEEIDAAIRRNAEA